MPYADHDAFAAATRTAWWPRWLKIATAKPATLAAPGDSADGTLLLGARPVEVRWTVTRRLRDIVTLEATRDGDVVATLTISFGRWYDGCVAELRLTSTAGSARSLRRALRRSLDDLDNMVLARTNTTGADTLAEARAALREVVPSLIALVRSISDPNAASVGTWGVADVAAHLSHVFRFDTDAIAGRPVPLATVNTAGMAELNATMLAEDDEHDPAVLADRIDASANEFDDVASRSTADTVSWLQGVHVAPSAVACHLLEECLVHGHDIARVTDHPWPIHRRHALLAIQGGVLPLIAALPPTAFVNQERSGSFRARIELRLRGGGRTLFAFDDRSLTLDSDARGDVDAYISADPAALMLTFIGRQGIAKPFLTGKLAAWGRRPWKLARMLAAMSPP